MTLQRAPGLFKPLAAVCLASMMAVLPAGAEPADWRESVRQLAAENFKNPAWGYSHALRDYDLARRLAAEDHVALDDDVMFAAAMLHDMAAFPNWAKAGVDHADQAASLVPELLKSAGFPPEKIEQVQGAIRTHMVDRDPLGPEALYLHDADALDWLGAIGVARIIGLVDANGGQPTGPQVIPMLESNLAKVPARVLSPAGRAQLDQRRAELVKFLDDLRRETDGLKTL